MTSKKKTRLSLALTFLFCILSIIPAADAATTLKKGVGGTDVLVLQQQLQKLGYFKVSPTGYFGPSTEASVKKLQRDYYLKPDGIVGPKTKKLINQLLGKPYSAKEVLGFYVGTEPGIPSSFDTLKAHKDKITSISPFWYRLDPQNPGELEMYGNPNMQQANQVINFSKDNDIKNYALVHNLLYDKHSTSKDVVHQVFADPRKRWALIMNIFYLLENKGFSGVCIDIENIHSHDRKLYTQFLAELSSQLKPAGYGIIAAVPAKTTDTPSGGWGDNFNYAVVGKYADFVAVMAYDEHTGFSSNNAGPIASAGWVDRVVKYALTKLPPEKILLGIPGYGFDWNYGDGTSRYLSHQMAVDTAQKYKKNIQWDARNQVPYFNYTDKKGYWHSVYFENASSTAAKLDTVNKYNLGGIALWRLGMEDPATWRVIAGKLGG